MIFFYQIKMMNTIEKTIRFYDYHYLSVNNPAHEKQYFDITITIKDDHFNYDISYIWKFSDAILDSPIHYLKHRIYPFPEIDYCDHCQTRFDKEGVIVTKNSLTETMIQYLLMSDEELNKQNIGRTYPQYYRVNIMKSLGLFWY